MRSVTPSPFRSPAAASAEPKATGPAGTGRGIVRRTPPPAPERTVTGPGGRNGEDPGCPTAKSGTPPPLKFPTAATELPNVGDPERDRSSPPFAPERTSTELDPPARTSGTPSRFTSPGPATEVPSAAAPGPTNVKRIAPVKPE